MTRLNTAYQVYRAYMDGYLTIHELRIAAGEIDYSDWCEIYRGSNLEPEPMPKVAAIKALAMIRRPETDWMGWLAYEYRRRPRRRLQIN